MEHKELGSRDNVPKPKYDNRKARKANISDCEDENKVEELEKYKNLFRDFVDHDKKCYKRHLTEMYERKKLTDDKLAECKDKKGPKKMENILVKMKNLCLERETIMRQEFDKSIKNSKPSARLKELE